MNVFNVKRTLLHFSFASVLATGVSMLPSARAGMFTANFNAAATTGARLHGSAKVEGGVLKLTTVSTNEQQGSFIIDALDADRPVGSFTVRFKIRAGGGIGGEGFSFNFAPDLPDAPFGEDGAGSGLTVAFDSFDSATGTPAGIAIKYGGLTIANNPVSARTGTNFVDVAITVSSGGAVEVVYGGKQIHANLFAYVPLSGRFGFGARTGERNDDHFVDDLSITTSVLDRPYVLSALPRGRAVRPDSGLAILIQHFRSQVNTNSIRLLFNGGTVTPRITKDGEMTTVTYDPPGLLTSGLSNIVQLTFADRSTPPVQTSSQYVFVTENYAVLPATARLPSGSVVLTNAGFRVRTVQGRANAGLEPTIARAEAQLAGTLIDPASGFAYQNEAKLGPNVDGTFDDEDVINYEQEGSPVGNFTNNEERIPGIPGRGGHNDSIAVEFLTYLEIPSGYHRFGVNSDDGFKVTSARDVRDSFATVLGAFDGTRRFSDTVFSFVTETNGFYPFRLVWFEAGGAASVEFYSETSDGSRILINDRSKSNAIKAYRPTEASVQTPPYVQSVSPKPGAAGVSRKPIVSIVLKDGQSQVDTNSVELKMDGEIVAPAISKAGDATSVSFQASKALESLTLHTVSLTYADNAKPANTNTRHWHFTTAQISKATGHWDFDEGNLKAKVGADLEYGDGLTGAVAASTQFGSTTNFGIPNIGNLPGKVMKYSRPSGPTGAHPGYLLKHGIDPNGGGSMANQWTLIMDVFFPDPQEGGFSSVLETESTSSGGDLFVRWNSVAGPGTGGLGIGGQYTGDGRTRMNIGNWHRIAFAVDLTTAPPLISKFIDGVKFQDQGLTAPQVDGRFALGPMVRLFSDDDYEVNTFYVNSIQVRDGKLPDDEVAALGGPSAEGIPLPVPDVGLTAALNGNLMSITWPASAAGFTLESTETLQNPVWKAVTGVTNNSVSLRITGSGQFFRLRR